MDPSTIPYTIEPMRLDDLPHVLAIERVSFPAPWPESGYRYELTQNELAHYSVVRTPDGTLIAYGGFWLLLDEAHISTLAVAPTWRRKGIGTLLLLALIEQAQALGAHVVTLEVRVSNLPAQNLYRRLGFRRVGRRKHYYHDNGEDALIFTTPPLDHPTYQAHLTACREKLWQRLVSSGAEEGLDTEDDPNSPKEGESCLN